MTQPSLHVLASFQGINNLGHGSTGALVLNKKEMRPRLALMTCRDGVGTDGGP